MVTTAEAARLRNAQAGVRTLVLADLADFWVAQSFDHPAATREALVGYSQDMVSRYGQDMAELTAQWYDQARAAEQVPGRFAAKAEPSPFLGTATERTVRRAAGGLWTGDLVAVMVTLRAVLPWYVTAAAQETVARAADRDPAAAGWQRVARSGACGFCRMLAGRGGVYTRAAVDFGSHSSCGCVAVPSWDTRAESVPTRAYVASARTSTMSPVQKAAHNARVRAWIEAEEAAQGA